MDADSWRAVKNLKPAVIRRKSDVGLAAHLNPLGAAKILRQARQFTRGAAHRETVAGGNQ
jgi:hypothetical protein